MSATISVLPFATSASDDAEDISGTVDGLSPNERRIARTIAIYERVARAPARSFDPEAVGAALRALNEGRTQDALELVEIAFEEADASLDDDDPAEEHEDSPAPDAAQIWRHSPRSGPICVADADTQRSDRDGGVRLVPKRRMIDSARHVAEIGDLEFDRRTCRSTIELGVRGEVIVMLHSGMLTIDAGDGLAPTELRCTPGTIEIVRLAFVAGRARRGGSRPLRLHLAADPCNPAQGLWCTSMIRDESATDDVGVPDEDLVFVTRFGAITSMSGDAFCEGATPARASRTYSHRSAIARGDFARYVLASGPTSTSGAWTLKDGPNSTEVLGLVAASGQPAVDPATNERELVAHGGALELIVGIDGVTWAAVSPTLRQSKDDSGQHVLALERGTDGRGDPVFVTPLVGTSDGRFDAMLLRPSYAHAVWLTPGSQARFVHVMFDDPERIRVTRQGRGARPAADRAARTAVAG